MRPRWSNQFRRVCLRGEGPLHAVDLNPSVYLAFLKFFARQFVSLLDRMRAFSPLTLLLYLNHGIILLLDEGYKSKFGCLRVHGTSMYVWSIFNTIINIMVFICIFIQLTDWPKIALTKPPKLPNIYTFYRGKLWQDGPQFMGASEKSLSL